MAASVSTSRSDGRLGRRIPKRLTAELSHPDESMPKEMTFTENVSTSGARVTTARHWQPGTRVLVTLLRIGVRSEGRVAYCQRKESGDFAIGVELSAQFQSHRGDLT
jgi:hypothetical protein